VAQIGQILFSTHQHWSSLVDNWFIRHLDDAGSEKFRASDSRVAIWIGVSVGSA
jgi:hypothetical protein